MNATLPSLIEAQLLASKHAADKTRGLTLTELEELVADARRTGVPDHGHVDVLVGQYGQVKRMEVFG